MQSSKLSFSVISVTMAALALSACVTNPDGTKRIDRTVIGGLGGAVGGYLLGDLVGGRRDRTEKIIGAGIGAVAGAGLGRYLEQQKRDLEQQTAGTGVEVTQEGDSLLVNIPSGITFPVDSAAIQPAFQQTLNDVAQTLNRYESSYIDVYGHTDSSGSDAYNQGLSERRAASVSAFLQRQGVNGARLATRGYGETQPVASNDTIDGRAQNRRVELRIVPVTQDDLG
jgi:outer membrane protein OmpA-like peptidoglycan-associated protein